VPCSVSRVVPGAHRGSGPREVHMTKPPPCVTTMRTPAQSHRRRRTKRDRRHQRLRLPPKLILPQSSAGSCRQWPWPPQPPPDAVVRGRNRLRPSSRPLQPLPEATTGRHTWPPCMTIGRDRCKPPVAVFLAPLLHITGEMRPRLN
jgi:hypothetical protein